MIIRNTITVFPESEFFSQKTSFLNLFSPIVTTVFEAVFFMFNSIFFNKKFQYEHLIKEQESHLHQ